MKEKIIEKSINLFAEQGFKETTIQQIVEELGVTKGTFYYYFQSKEEVLVDIQMTYIERLLTAQREIFHQKETTCKDKIYELMVRIVSEIRTEGLKAKVFIREMRHVNEIQLKSIKQKRNEFRNNLIQVLEEAMRKREIQSHIPAEMIAFGILGMTNWTYFWYDPDGERTEEEIVSYFHQIIMNGIEKMEE